MDFPTKNDQVVERLPKCTLCQIKFGAAKIIHSSNRWGSNHLLRMVMQPEYLAEEVVVHFNWIPREWIFRQKFTKWQLSKFQFKHCAEVTTTTWTNAISLGFSCFGSVEISLPRFLEKKVTNILWLVVSTHRKNVKVEILPKWG